MLFWLTCVELMPDSWCCPSSFVVYVHYLQGIILKRYRIRYRIQSPVILLINKLIFPMFTWNALMYMYNNHTCQQCNVYANKGPHLLCRIVLLTSASASALASHQLQREPLLSFFWEACFLFPSALAFDFILLSRSSCESVFHRNGFFPNVVKSTRGILTKRVRKLHRQVTHDLIIVYLQLTYFCIHCAVGLCIATKVAIRYVSRYVGHDTIRITIRSM